MSDDKLRHRLAWEAARLMYRWEESEYIRAKMKAARRLGSGQPKPHQLPTNRQIRHRIRELAIGQEGRLTNGDDDQSERLEWDALVAQRSAAAKADSQPRLDRFLVYRTLLLPLELDQREPKTPP